MKRHFEGIPQGLEMAWITDQEQQVSTWDSVFWNFRGRNNSGCGGGGGWFLKTDPPTGLGEL